MGGVMGSPLKAPRAPDVLVLPIVEYLEEELHALRCQESNIRNQRRDSTGGVGAATEPKQEDLIPNLPVVAQEAIALADVLGDGGARRAADDAVLDAAARADSRVVEDDLRGARLGGGGGDGAGVEGAADAGYV
ncbi:hypothetical protein V490_09011 [Pseudogymnoascus sp. VKM F-3557]|nr:hypothetical protein V490_09011 [Pseudogymnoascus sp. VKM F-3557]